MTSPTLYEVLPIDYRQLDEVNRRRIARGLDDSFGLSPSEVAVVWTDDSGTVMGAMRFVLDDDGRKVIENDAVKLEPVGVTP